MVLQHASFPVLVRLGRMGPRIRGFVSCSTPFSRVEELLQPLLCMGCRGRKLRPSLFRRCALEKRRAVETETDELESAERRSCFVVLDGLTSLALLGYGRGLLFGMVQELDDATATRRQSSRGACEAQPLKRTATGQPLNGGKRSADAEAN